MSQVSPHAVSFCSGLPLGATPPPRLSHECTGVAGAVVPDAAATSATQAPAYTCARGLTEVRTAWGIVYERYVAKKLIHENPFGIHTVPQAVGQRTCVIHGANQKTAGSTFTLIGDTSKGLPLDSIYTKELDALRWQDRGLVEVGLLAERARGTRRGVRALFDMLCWAIHYTLHIGSTDIVIGVHPHHEPFYGRCFGAKRFARPTTYPLVNDNPVVPLRLPVREALVAKVLPRGLAHVRDHPIDAGEFRQRFRFESEQLRGSTIERFLAERHVPTDASEQVTGGTVLRGGWLPTRPTGDNGHAKSARTRRKKLTLQNATSMTRLIQ